MSKDEASMLYVMSQQAKEDRGECRDNTYETFEAGYAAGRRDAIMELLDAWPTSQNVIVFETEYMNKWYGYSPSATVISTWIKEQLKQKLEGKET